MGKVIVLALLLSALHLDISESATLQCEYQSDNRILIQNPYFCYVQNSVNITSNDSAYITKITGTHANSTNNNDDVIGLYIHNKTVQYFPRGLEKIFNNLKVIKISGSGLKVVQQSDLKSFQNLVELHLDHNQLEVIEEGLFDFNFNLELIFLSNNKISFIDPKVFDSLVRLRFLNLDSNICIDMKTENDLTNVQDVIKVLKDQCDAFDYYKLNLKFKKLEIESKNLNSEDFKAELRNLEDEIKNSKFVNFFEQKLQNLPADQMKISLEEISTASVVTSSISQLLPLEMSQKSSEKSKNADYKPKDKNFKEQVNNDVGYHQDAPKFGSQCPSFNETLTGVKNNIKEAVMRCTGNFADVHERFSNLNETILDIQKSTVDVKQSNDDIVTRLQSIEDNLVSMETFVTAKYEKLETKINAVHNDLILATKNEINLFERKFDGKFQKIEEKLAKIMKALKIAE